MQNHRNKNSGRSSQILELLDRYDLFLFDAYGVLVNEHGPLPGAINCIQEVRRRNKEFIVLTNDASKTLDYACQKYQGLGFDIDIENIISSGSLVKDYFYENELLGAKCIVMGGAQSEKFVSEAGGVILPLAPHAEPDVIVLLDSESGSQFGRVIDSLISIVTNALNRNSLPALVVANPDLLYPCAAGEYAIAAGSVANILEGIISARFSDLATTKFVRLGKPYEPIFKKALESSKRSPAIMIGDQLATDILGAKKVGIDSAIVFTGITGKNFLLDVTEDLQPTYMLENLQ